jgi:hypothetical protein
MPRHPDFEKIYQAFIKHYGEKEGATLYQIWISKLSLDDTKPYEQLKEKFSWSPSYVKYLKEDETAKYFECEALFPLTSMNNNLYTITELQQRAASIIDKTVNWNHTNELAKDVSIPDAEFYNGCVRCLLKVMKGSNDLKRIESGESVNQSVEVDCRRGITETPNGNQCNGLVFTGLALLTKDVLPGVPLTRIMPVEKLVESFTVTGVTNLSEKGKQESKPENSGQQARQNAVDKNDPERPFIFALEAWLAKNTEEDYPWDQCIADHKAHGYDDDSAARICAAIKNRSVAHSLQNGLAKTTEEAVDLVAKNVKENPYLSYLAGLLVQKPKESQEKTKPPPEPQRRKEEPKNEPCKCVLTQEGFWARFHQLRSEGASKSEAFRLVSMEVIAAASKKSKS